MSSTLAIDGGTPVRSAPFPQWPMAGDEEGTAIAEVLASGRWGSTHGDRVAGFEDAFARYQQAAYGICLANGTMALVAALTAMGVGPGDEVIVPAYTFVASASAVLFANAVPVFADIRADTHLIEADQVEALITPRTRAIMAVHIAGRPCDLDALMDLGARHGIPVIEDAAQAHGASWRGRRVGAIGACGTFSFQTSKNISAGEGGVVVTDDEALADEVYSMVNLGRVRGGGWYQHDRVGYNLRLTEFQAAVLTAQLGRHPQQQATRSANAAVLTSLLSDAEVVLPAEDPRVTEHGLHLFVFQVPDRDRDAVVRALTAEGIPCLAGYAGLHRNKALRHKAEQLAGLTGMPLAQWDCPVTDRVAAATIWLPHHTLLGSVEDTADIAVAVGKVLGG
ncbi:dTDP-4-amino-4,6-dideoxygalactose transaminase [Hamadaea flava]|uniref:DegT/DnrJ/EryC1/StrS family aminotransferase n=1 Tax=Hamadaea flava TaxID=1742688 RepID=A0ABV8LDU7_9ACTN|nr:DegT/DnrJ/EryC1/StrS family aminotransferase [Hamadaea flava]MCP2329459.1 dTDP-4-amino-4,6-dideoxygalactose transaminase [Hamadaea flava]